MTALMLAAEMGHSGSVRLLLSYNADPNLQNADEYTALLLAAEAGHVQVVRDICQFLKDKKIPPKEGIDKSNKFGKTPFIMAAEFNRMEVLQTLAEFGADVNARSKRGLTGLQLAAVKKHKDIVEYLCSVKADTKSVSMFCDCLLQPFSFFAYSRR
jgi:ankyrin repeat protein